jgi:hypothetical protein
MRKRSNAKPITVPVRISPALLARIDALIPKLQEDPDVEGRVSRSFAIRKFLLNGVKYAEIRYGVAKERSKESSR